MPTPPTMRPHRRTHGGGGDGHGRLGRVLIPDLRPSSSGFGEANMMPSAGMRPQTTQGGVPTSLQCSLSRKRMVFATGRWRRTTVAAGAGVSRPPRFDRA
jgi:hypothetical protein